MHRPLHYYVLVGNTFITGSITAAVAAVWPTQEALKNLKKPQHNAVRASQEVADTKMQINDTLPECQIQQQ